MTKVCSLLVPFLAAILVPQQSIGQSSAQQNVATYRCVDAAGTTSYTNQKKEMAGKQCALVSREAASAGVFSGLQSVKYLVEDLPDEANACGIHKADLETAAGFAIFQSKLQINSNANWFLYYRTLVRYLGPIRGCAIYVGLQARMRAIAEHNKATEWATFWEYSSLGVVSESDSKKEVLNAVDRITKVFLIEWSKQNQH